MGQTHSRIRCIDTLSTITRCTHDIDTDILIRDINLIHFLCLRKHCYTGGTCMDSSATLCLRHALYTMDATFIFQYGIRTISGYHRGY